MRVTICAVGRARNTPEAAIVADYLDRFDRLGRNLGLGPARLVEVEARGGGRAAEARQLEAALPASAVVIALDGRGRLLGSEDFAARLGGWAGEGRRDLAFLIGGADGLDPGLRAKADLLLSFGPMVWPHLLARVMLAEQLYRAASILAGTPYHRGD
jgi:23S rRNA (pseudouridine1915-N3)-methyltransferase